MNSYLLLRLTNQSEVDCFLWFLIGDGAKHSALLDSKFLSINPLLTKQQGLPEDINSYLQWDYSCIDKRKYVIIYFF